MKISATEAASVFMIATVNWVCRSSSSARSKKASITSCPRRAATSLTGRPTRALKRSAPTCWTRSGAVSPWKSGVRPTESRNWDRKPASRKSARQSPTGASSTRFQTGKRKNTKAPERSKVAVSGDVVTWG